MTKTTVDIQAFINEHPFIRYQWMILALCFITVAMNGFDTTIIGFIVSDLVQEWGVEGSAPDPVMSVALVGPAVDVLITGPLADHIDRRKVLIMSIVVFGGFNLLTALATSLSQLTLLRFLTDLGPGAAMPNATTLMSGYAPECRRVLLVNLTFVGLPMGSSLGGFLSAWTILHYDWQNVLVPNDVAPLLLAIALVFLLPESARYLVVKQQLAQCTTTISKRIAPLSEAVEFELREAGQVRERSAIGVIFSPRYAVDIVMLCLTYSVGLLIFYPPTSWLSLLIRETGVSMSQASITTAPSPLDDGIGVLILGVPMGRVSPNKVVAVGWLLTGIYVCLVDFSTSSLVLMEAMVFIADNTISGTQSSMSTLTVGLYSTQGRAAGAAWMLGTGRFGGILGVFSGTFPMQAQLSFETIFTLLAIPAFLSALAPLIKYQVSKSVPATEDSARGPQKA